VAAAGRAFSPTLAVPGIRKPKLRALARKAELIGSDVEMSRCFRWRCGLVFGIIITNFTLSNNTFNLFTIYFSILQCTIYSCATTLSHARLFLRGDGSERRPLVKSIFSLTNHIAIVFPPLSPFRYTQPSVSPTFGSIQLCQSWLIFKMETSKRRQIPTTNASRGNVFPLFVNLLLGCELAC